MRKIHTLAATGALLTTVVGMGAATAPAAYAAPQDSYQLTSSEYKVSAHSNSQQIHALCGDGYHVAGKWGNNIVTSPYGARYLASSAYWVPSLTIHGDWITQDSATGYQQNGADSNGNPTYQGVDVRLENLSLISSHTGSFTWTCNAN